MNERRDESETKEWLKWSQKCGRQHNGEKIQWGKKVKNKETNRLHPFFMGFPLRANFICTESQLNKAASINLKAEGAKRTGI